MVDIVGLGHGVVVLDLMKKAIILYAMTGNPTTFVKDIMSLGFAHMKTSVSMRPCQDLFGRNALRIFWMRLFKSKRALSSHEKLLPTHSYLQEDFEQPLQLLPYGKECVGQISAEITTSGDYVESNGTKSLYPKHSGQVKIEGEPKKACKTVDTDQMFTDKDSIPLDEKVHFELREIYTKQYWYDRNLPMVVTYPCKLSRKRKFQETHGVSKRKCIIPKVIIDKENASALLNYECQKCIKGLKQHQQVFDWDGSDEVKFLVKCKNCNY
ncbi:3838_t:CDS:2 [Ambispora gerdemannii]|uniref:3838_t:CDS:1 n=1 Tax=Ambispora gerdemannii TaxID=144530 RepID=A0A9N8W9S6_9GLOM|nr:3838_t:CDS:2 [Ambispora gerdemannii]